VVKLVYTTDSKSVAFERGGSSPPTGTIQRKPVSKETGFFIACVMDQHRTGSDQDFASSAKFALTPVKKPLAQTPLKNLLDLNPIFLREQSEGGSKNL
jgi:hypothetical protein